MIFSITSALPKKSALNIFKKTLATLFVHIPCMLTYVMWTSTSFSPNFHVWFSVLFSERFQWIWWKLEIARSGSNEMWVWYCSEFIQSIHISIHLYTITDIHILQSIQSSVGLETHIRIYMHDNNFALPFLSVNASFLSALCYLVPLSSWFNHSDFPSLKICSQCISCGRLKLHNQLL